MFELTQNRQVLTTDRYRQKDFFVADIFDTSIKDDLNSMEHPLFALKAGDKRARHYEHNGISVTLKPGFDGLATIHDKDIWIYCISQLVEAINREREDIQRTIRFTAYDFLKTTNRRTDGDSYNRMGDALNRLQSTTIETNIETAQYRERAGFSLIDSWRVIERSPNDNRMVAVEVALPDWLFRSVKSMQVLTLSRDYFRIRRPVDRRIYELARKHCGNQTKWTVSVAVLHKKTGSASLLRNFRQDIKSLAKSNELPDYRIMFDEVSDTVNFYARGGKGARAQIGDVLKKQNTGKKPLPKTP